MEGFTLKTLLWFIQHGISLAGILIILSGVLLALYQYAGYLFTGQLISKGAQVNSIRLSLGRILVLGLECIVAADLIGTTTTPDYYAVGILACIVLIRTVLSYTINREIMSLSKDS